MPQAAEEQFPRAPAVCIHVEAEAEVGDVQVDGEGDDGEGPRGDVQHGGSRRQSNQGQAMAQCHTPAEGWVRDRHHAVASSGVVFAEAPAQGVEVGELPGVQDPAQKECACAEGWGERGQVRCQQRFPKEGSFGPKVLLDFRGLCPVDQQQLTSQPSQCAFQCSAKTS